jgi:hypothetical protein
MSEVLPNIERGFTWSQEYRHQCEVRTVIRWRIEDRDSRFMITLEAVRVKRAQRSRPNSTWSAMSVISGSKNNRGNRRRLAMNKIAKETSTRLVERHGRHGADRLATEIIICCALGKVLPVCAKGRMHLRVRSNVKLRRHKENPGREI